MIIDTSKRSFWVGVGVVVVGLICVSLFMWYNHKTAITTEEIIQSSKEAIKASKEAAQKIEYIRQDIKAIMSDAKKAGDTSIQEMQSASDVEFIDKLNEYSRLMVERVTTVE